MLTNCEDLGMISVLKIATARLTSADYETLKSAEAQIVARGRTALLVDLSAVRRVTRSGLAALAEFQSEAPRQVSIGFFGASQPVQGAFQRCALSSLLTVFENLPEALNAAPFRERRLTGVKAVVLVAGAGRRMAPLSQTTPKPLLDFLGRSVLEHNLAHLGRFGICDVILNPGHLAPQFHAHVESTALRRIQFVNEGTYRGTRWTADPAGSASTLLKLQNQNYAFTEDFIALCGDAVCDVDLADVMAQHKASGAEVTIVAQKVPPAQVHSYGIIDVDGHGRIRKFVEKPKPQDAPSTLASTGIYVFHPRALQRLPQGIDQDIALDLLPAILAAGGHLQVYRAPMSWTDMGCGRDYYTGLSRGLRGLIPNVVPQGREVRRHTWAAPGAYLSPRAVVVGPCYLGPDAVVEAGAKLEGPTVIGAGARVEPRSLVRRSVVWANTRVCSGTWVDDMIVSPDWAIDHRAADGSAQPNMPLEGVTSVAEPVAAPVPHNEQVPAIGGH